MGQGCFKVVADLFVEIVVLLLADVFFSPRPNGVGFVDGFPVASFHHGAGLASTVFIAWVDQFAIFPFFLFHQDGKADVVRVFADNPFDFPSVGIVLCVFTQVQGDAGAALFARNRLDFKRAASGSAIADPTHALCHGQAGAAGLHGDFVGHDKARIKPHTKLTNELGVGFLVTAEFGDKVFGSALSDGAQVVDGFLLRKPNAVVGDSQGFGVFVKSHFDFELCIVFQ